MHFAARRALIKSTPLRLASAHNLIPREVFSRFRRRRIPISLSVEGTREEEWSAGQTSLLFRREGSAPSLSVGATVGRSVCLSRDHPI
jgi:hypothetical protein